MYSSYITYLHNDESLDELCQRLGMLPAQGALEDLIYDLIIGKLDMLIKYRYLKMDRDFSPSEQVFIWLNKSPFYIRKISQAVFDHILNTFIEAKRWDVVHTVLMATNSNKKGVSPAVLWEILQRQEHIPSDMEIKIGLTLLNLQLEAHISLHEIEKWERLIEKNMENKPYMVLILMKLYSKPDPKKSLSLLSSISQYIPRIPEPKVRMIFQNTLKETIVNHFDYYKTTPAEHAEATKSLVSWSFTIKNSWILDLVWDVLDLSTNKNIKKIIEQEYKSYFQEFWIYSKTYKEFDRLEGKNKDFDTFIVDRISNENVEKMLKDLNSVLSESNS